DRRGPAPVRRLAHGFPPLRTPLLEPRLRGRSYGRGVLDVLRRPLSGAGAAGGTAAPDVADGVPPGRAGGVVGREVRVGAGQLVRGERPRRGPRPPPARMGGADLVAGHRRRAPRVPGASGA